MKFSRTKHLLHIGYVWCMGVSLPIIQYWWLFSVFYLVYLCTYMPYVYCNITMLSFCCVFCLIKFSVVQSIYKRTILYVDRWCVRCVSLILNLFFSCCCSLLWLSCIHGFGYEYKINNDGTIPHQNTKFVAFWGDSMLLYILFSNNKLWSPMI